MTKEYDYDACVDLLTAIIKPSKEVNNQLWQGLQKSGLLKRKGIDVFEIMHWLAEYMTVDQVDVTMSRKDFEKLIKLINKLKESKGE